MILSKDSILDAISNNTINIVCHYFEKESGEKIFTKKLDCKHSYKNSDRYHFLVKQIEGTRISLTLGPLLHLLNEDRAPEGGNYHSYDSIIDLTQKTMKDGYFLQPKESVVILTNEYVGLNPSIGGFIISRVNNNSLGLNVKSSYVSNGWSGLLKLTLRNESSSPFLLKHGMNIAGLFLYEVKGLEEKPSTNHFSANHYGLTWQAVYDRNENPFTELPKTFVNNKKIFRTLLAKKYNLGLDLAMLTILGGIIYGFIDMKNKLDSLTSEKNKLQLLQQDVKNIKTNYSLNKYQSGTSTVIISKGNINGSIDESIQGVITNSHYIMTDISSNKNLISSLKTNVSGSTGRHTLIIRLTLDKPQKTDTVVDIKWIVFP